MSSRWDTKGVPHKGWKLVDVIDIRPDGQSPEETEYEVCMMCNNEKIRFVHVVEHPDFPEALNVGCVCAENMTNDYINPRERERELKNKSNRRTNWIKRKWRVNQNGSHILNVNGNRCTIFVDKRTKKYKCILNDVFGTKLYASVNEAKIGLFNRIENS